MTVLLKAQPLVDARLPELQNRCQLLIRQGIRPKLVVVLVGDHPASLSYITKKRELCERVGASFELRHLAATSTAEELKAVVESINRDASVHGCIIQLPVQGPAKSLPLESLVAPKKDVDGFHPQNTSALYLGKLTEHSLLPCTPKGVMSVLKHYGIDPGGMNAVVIGRSQIVGKPLALLLSLAGATVTICHSGTRDLAEHTKRADLIVCAAGAIDLLRARHIDPTKQSVVIDVGVSRNAAGKLVGDVKFAEVAPLVKAITPVPGGIGPLTVLSLIENLLIAAQNLKDAP